VLIGENHAEFVLFFSSNAFIFRLFF